MAEPETRSVEINGAALHVADTGAGDPLVLIHGSLDGMQTFRRQLPEFSRHYRVVSYARRFHPPSEEHVQSRYTLETHTDDLLALLDAFELERAHLVGSSYGAYVGLGVALGAPGRVRSLVLGEPPILPFLLRTGDGRRALEEFRCSALEPAREAFARQDLRSGVAFFVDGIWGMPGAFTTLPEASQAELLRFGPELALELSTAHEQFMPDIACAALGELEMPVLLVSGERSPRLFHLIIEELARCLKHARRVEVRSAGHAMHLMNPRLYTREVLAFLETIV
jgi:non-heme chloroperoxidase